MVELQIVVLVVAGSSPVGHPIFKSQNLVSVAQPDRASDFGSEGCGFESLQARFNLTAYVLATYVASFIATGGANFFHLATSWPLVRSTSAPCGSDPNLPKRRRKFQHQQIVRSSEALGADQTYAG